MLSDGESDVWTDDNWEKGLKIWDLLNKPSQGYGPHMEWTEAFGHF